VKAAARSGWKDRNTEKVIAEIGEHIDHPKF
jgi:hypothetical protein